MNVYSQTEQLNNDLDLSNRLVDLKDSWKPIVTAVVSAALLALALSHLIPPTYVSSALVLTADPRVEAFMRSPRVLDDVLKNHPESGDSQDERREALSDRIRITKVKTTNSKPDEAAAYQLTVSHRDAEMAKKTHDALLAAWRKSTIPLAETRAKIEQKISNTQIELVAVNKSIERLESELLAGRPVEPLAMLYDQRLKFRTFINNLSDQLNGAESDVVVSEPTLPDRSSGVPTLLIVALAAIAAFLLSATWALLRSAAKNGNSPGPSSS